MKQFLLLVITITALGACQRKDTTNYSEPVTDSSSVHLKYATGFSVQYINNAKLVEVKYPFQGATSGYKYLLVQKGQQAPQGYKNYKTIEIPLESIVCTSTSHIPLLDYLGETHKLIGFPTLEYVSSQAMRARIDSGKVADLGIDQSINLEILASLQPDMVMGYVLTGNYGHFRKIEELGIPVVINAEYLEKDPLGRAEWIKFMALFFNKEDVADSVFSVIENNYEQTKTLIPERDQKPTVMSGVVYGDAWFLPGGQNYAAKLYRDAGYDYLWSDDSSHGYLELSFESVYTKARDADYWIGVASYQSLREIKDADHRYTQFKPYKEQQVYTYTSPETGNAYLELGYLRPDLILKDLIKISDPALLPSHTLYFHKRLK